MHAMRQLFTGRIAWSLHGDQLTLRKDGGPTIVYTSRDIRPAQSPFSATVLLDRTTAPANGESLSGYLVVRNETGAPIVITNACNGWFGVGLSRPHVQDFAPGFTDVACASKDLPVGTTRIPIRVSTAYDECAEPGGVPPKPKCVGPNHNVSPPLPPGDYVTTVGFANLSRQPTQGTPVRVSLTAP